MRLNQELKYRTQLLTLFRSELARRQPASAEYHRRNPSRAHQRSDCRASVTRGVGVCLQVARPRGLVNTDAVQRQWPLAEGATDWRLVEQMFRHIFSSELRVDPDEHPIFVTEPPGAPRVFREQLVRMGQSHCMRR